MTGIGPEFIVYDDAPAPIEMRRDERGVFVPAPLIFPELWHVFTLGRDGSTHFAGTIDRDGFHPAEPEVVNVISYDMHVSLDFDAAIDAIAPHVVREAQTAMMREIERRLYHGITSANDVRRANSDALDIRHHVTPPASDAAE
jgi:hypothetical protein